ncbi:lectin-like domain-containing protein [Cellulomonas massiliensis]|uniref:lectin-like domain-containing protein n=1 Tax=Cellulomonas massiliensis TaxID=1465811 RepID=UPI0002F662F1|nr:DUF11 domain-containing protein [Cellulomonas massiliensis]
MSVAASSTASLRGARRTGRARRPLAVLAVAAVLGGAVVAPALADPFPVDEPFTGSAFEDPAWVLPAPGTNSATLTGDALRLTESGTGFAVGNATLADPFRSDVAFTASFDLAVWGGGFEGDAMTFFLQDASVAPELGGAGGSGGYQAMGGAYLAIGFDSAGNFSADSVFPNDPGSVVLRGAAGLPAPLESWPVLAVGKTSDGSVHAEPSQPRHVEIAVEPAPDRSILVTVRASEPGGANLTTIWDRVDVRTLNPARGQPAVPERLQLGFSASTGGATATHEVTALVATAAADLALAKSGPASVEPGGDVTWTLDVTNDATNPVEGALVSDTLPAGATDVTWSCTATTGSSCSDASGTAAQWPTLDLERGGGATIEVTAVVPDALAGVLLTNTATVTAPADRTETSLGDNTGSTTTQVLEPPDLAVTAALVGTSPVARGSTGAWTVQVSNVGRGDAPASEVEVVLPEVLDPASVALPSGCTLDVRTVTCDLGALAAGAGPVTLTLAGGLTGDARACLDEGAPLTATASTSRRELVTDNNVATVDAACTLPVDVSLRKTGPSQAHVGDEVTWTVRAANAGPSPALGTTVTDTLPAGATDARWTCRVSDGAPCSPASGTGDVVTTADIPAGGEAVVTVTATAGAPGSLSNAATVVVCEGCTDASTVDDAASSTVRVLAAAGPTPGPTEPPSSPEDGLALTGSPVAGLLGVAVAALVGGVALVVGASRRGRLRRPQRSSAGVSGS